MQLAEVRSRECVTLRLRSLQSIRTRTVDPGMTSREVGGEKSLCTTYACANSAMERRVRDLHATDHRLIHYTLVTDCSFSVSQEKK